MSYTVKSHTQVLLKHRESGNVVPSHEYESASVLAQRVSQIPFSQTFVSRQKVAEDEFCDVVSRPFPDVDRETSVFVPCVDNSVFREQLIMFRRSWPPSFPVYLVTMALGGRRCIFGFRYTTGYLYFLLGVGQECRWKSVKTGDVDGWLSFVASLTSGIFVFSARRGQEWRWKFVKMGWLSRARSSFSNSSLRCQGWRWKQKALQIPSTINDA
jgi:hypothetical protein